MALLLIYLKTPLPLAPLQVGLVTTHAAPIGDTP